MKQPRKTLTMKERRKRDEAAEMAEKLKNSTKSKVPTMKDLFDRRDELEILGFCDAGPIAKKVMLEAVRQEREERLLNENASGWIGDNKRDIDLAKEKEDEIAKGNDMLQQIDLDAVRTIQDFYDILPALRQLSQTAQRQAQVILQNKLSSTQGNDETRRRNGDFDDRVLQLRKKLESKIKQHIRFSHKEVNNIIAEEVQRYLATSEEQRKFCNGKGYYQKSQFKVDPTPKDLEEMVKKTSLRNVKILSVPGKKV